MIRRAGIVALGLLAALVPAGRPAAQQLSKPALEETGSDLFQLNLKLGGGSFSYREESSIVSGRYNGKVGLAEATGSVRLAERVRFFLGATGAFTGEDSEEFTRAFSATGGAGTSEQDNDLDIALFLFEPDIRYRVLHNPHVDLDVILGWAAVYMTLDRTNIEIDNVSRPGTFKETRTGHGPRVGASARFTIPQLPPALSFLLEGTYNNLIGVNVDSDFLDGNPFTRGFGVKWNVGFMYRITQVFSFGFGYQGLFLDLDRSDRTSGGVGTIRHGGQMPENSSRVDAIYLNLHWLFGG